MLKLLLLGAILVASEAPCPIARAQSQTPPLSPKPMQRMSLNGVIHDDTDDTLAFTPDGMTVFFDRSQGSHKTIMVSHTIGGEWTTPQVASFSGRWFDQDPIVSPDGKYLLFNSDRPVSKDSRPLTQTYFSKTPAPGSNIWRVDRKGAGWGEPRWLGSTINSDVFIDFASIARDNTLYFMRWDADNRVMQLWQSKFVKGRYETPERVALGNAMVSIHDPSVSADQSYMVFDYGKVQGGLGRLCIAFRKGEGWSDPIDLGDAVNKDLPWGAHMAPDGRTVYVTGQSGIWQLQLDPWLSERASGNS
jgi:hypothetical protein